MLLSGSTHAKGVWALNQSRDSGILMGFFVAAWKYINIASFSASLEVFRPLVAVGFSRTQGFN